MSRACRALLLGRRHPLVMAALLVACSDDAQSPRPRSAGTTSSSGGHAATSSSSSSSSGSSVVDAATNGQATTYRGILDATPATQFGGLNGHCTYAVTLRNVVIELDLLPDGTPIGGAVEDLMVEDTVGSCPYVPQPSNQQHFAFQNVDGGALTWVGAATNAPKTNLTITLTKTGGSYEAAAVWERTDRTDDLQWVVKTRLTLGPK